MSEMPNSSFGIYYKWAKPAWKYRPALPCSWAKAPGPDKGKMKFGYKQYWKKDFSKSWWRAPSVKYS